MQARGDGTTDTVVTRPRMRIGIQTWGTEGDVRPFFALAKELVRRGHEVRLAYTSVEGRDFDALASACGISASGVGADYFREHREQIAARVGASFELGPVKQVQVIFKELMDPVVDVLLEASDALAAWSEVMIAHFMTFPAKIAAEKHGRPFVVVGMQPIIPSKHFPPIGAPQLGRLLNPLLWKLMNRLVAGVTRERINATRARSGLPPALGADTLSLEDAALALIALSPSLFARPPDWAENVQLSGFLAIPDESEAWAPSDDLRRFLDGSGQADQRPVFLSFGSMFAVDQKRTIESVRIFADALTLAGLRGIIQAPAEVIASAPDLASVRYIERAPHRRLFPQCSVIVHHGGAGTTQAALLAGRPSIVVPHVTDQFYFADLLYARGVAAKPLRRTSLAAKPLAARMRDVIAQPEMTSRAEALARSIASEDGAARAADLIEGAMKSPART